MTEFQSAHLEEDIFLGRFEEQERFQEALKTVVQESGLLQKITSLVTETNPKSLPFIFLLYGEGGMGKSRLTQRLRKITSEASQFKDKFKVIEVDWEKRKQLDFRLISRDNLSPETVFEHIYMIFRDAGFGKQFDPYEEAVKKRVTIESKVAQALDQAQEAGERYSKLRDLGGKGLAWLVNSGMLANGITVPLPNELMSQAFGELLAGGASALSSARDVATTFLRAKLKPDEFDLFTLPHEILARKLADGIRAVADAKPILLALDTYEIADRTDAWLRVVIQSSGPRVVWLLAGRNNLADSRKFGNTYFTGYRADFSSERLRVFPLGEFSVNDVIEYFRLRVSERPLDQPTAEAIHQVTLGIPLAVREAAAIWKTGTALDTIVGNVPARAPRAQIVKVMTERFLLHCFDDPAHPDDRCRLYALALLHKPDAEILAAMLGTDNLEATLSDLERRHSFVFVDQMKLHDSVAGFFREYLLNDLRRHDPGIRQLHQRAFRYLEQKRARLESQMPFLADCVENENWTETVLAQVYYGFWLEEDCGMKLLLDSLITGLGYDSDFARALVESANFFTNSLSNFRRKQFQVIEQGISGGALLDNRQKLLTLLHEAYPGPEKEQPSERRAILFLKHGEFFARQEKIHEALEACQQAESEIPENNLKLKKKLGEVLLRLTGKLIWPAGSGDACYSNEAAAILLKIQPWLPEKSNLWYNTGVNASKKKDFKTAITAYKKALALDETHASPHNGLGNVYFDLKRYAEAIAAYQQALALDEKYALPHNGLGNVYSALKRYAEAIAAYQQAIALDEKYASPHNNLGIVYRNQKRYAEAIAAYQQALALDEKDVIPHNNLGNVYRLLNRFEDALHAYLQAVQLEPEDATIHCCLAAVYKKLNFLDEYHAHLAIAQKFIQNETTYNQACFEAVTGNPEAALALLGKALENKEVDWDWAQQDPDFDAIRDDPRFQALLGKFETTRKEETGN